MRIPLKPKDEQNVTSMASRICKTPIDAGTEVLLEASQPPIAPGAVLQSVMVEIAALPSGAEFTVGELARKAYPNRQFIYTMTASGPKPDTTLSTVGRMAAASSCMTSGRYRKVRVDGRTQVFVKL